MESEPLATILEHYMLCPCRLMCCPFCSLPEIQLDTSEDSFRVNVRAHLENECQAEVLCPVADCKESKQKMSTLSKHLLGHRFDVQMTALVSFFFFLVLFHICLSVCVCVCDAD